MLLFLDNIGQLNKINQNSRIYRPFKNWLIHQNKTFKSGKNDLASFLAPVSCRRTAANLRSKYSKTLLDGNLVFLQQFYLLFFFILRFSQNASKVKIIESIIFFAMPNDSKTY
jgi:hypothetical protein